MNALRIGIVLTLSVGACSGGGASVADALGDGGIDAQAVVDATGDTAAGPELEIALDAEEAEGFPVDVDADGEFEAAPDPGTDAEPDPGTDAGPETSVITLDPATLQFFGLPINSVRYAVSGYDPARRTCVTLIWDYSNNDQVLRAHCDDFFPGFPYVLLKADTDGPCGAWDYAGDTGLVAASGCVDFAETASAGVDLVDVRVTVSGPAFEGVIVADNRGSYSPRPVSICLSVPVATAEPVWIQTTDDDARPGWLRIRRDGVEAEVFDRCDIPLCGGPQPACSPWPKQAEPLPTADGPTSVCVTWDRRERVVAPGADCYTRVAASPGSYTAQACYGGEVVTVKETKEVLSLLCNAEPLPLDVDTLVVPVPVPGDE